MQLESFKLIGSVHIFPHVSICYDSTICERAINIGWLWWGLMIVKKSEMHL